MKFVLYLTSFIVYILLDPSLIVCIAAHTLAQSQTISDSETLVSNSGEFELGFFSIGNPNKNYLGIRYKNIPVQNVVWVANSCNPVNDSTAILRLNSSGSLVLTHNNEVVWSTSSPKEAQNPVAELEDSGNLVIRDGNEAKQEEYLWQSFDYPSDTMLSGMRVGWDLKRNLSISVRAWKSDDDPTPGDLSWGIVLHPYPEVYMMMGTTKYHRLGPWNGVRFSGMPDMRPNPVFLYEFVSTKEQIYYIWKVNQTSLTTKVVLNQTNQARTRYVWSDSETAKLWMFYSSMPGDHCDHYGVCGANAYCRATASPICECLKGFKPKSPERWNSMDWSLGCVLKHPLNCKDKLDDQFVLVQALKVPDTSHTLVDETIDLKQCKAKCLNNCSCMAYTNSNTSGLGSGCVMWFGELFDIKRYPVPEDGQNLYIRVPVSELEGTQSKNSKILFVSTTVAAASGMLLLGIYFIYRIWRSINEKSKAKDNCERYVDDLDLPLLNLSIIITATANFSDENKIGEGGFGPVYWGKLASGLEIAVKRLSKSSGQGVAEFVNEVKLIAKLQHRNLVKLLGCCIQKEEKMLVYEYMVNGSLDYFIFDHTKGKSLDWPKRFHIICGIARGLMYLHQDSRLRIVHRDLKTSNILLDDDLNPKISDFGMARIFGSDEIEGNTERIVGTYGYMAPEYAVDGQFSIKSDVFSFGIMLLEIICGLRNRGRYRAKQSLNLVHHAWTYWNLDTTLEIIDPNIKDSCIASEVLRCIHIGLLCLQQYPEDRPTMTSVVLMLGSEVELDEPKKPAFCTKKEVTDTNSSSSNSTSTMTITLSAR